MRGVAVRSQSLEVLATGETRLLRITPDPTDGRSGELTDDGWSPCTTRVAYLGNPTAYP